MCSLEEARKTSSGTEAERGQFGLFPDIAQGLAVGPKADIPQRSDQQIFVLTVEFLRIHEGKFYSQCKIAR